MNGFNTRPDNCDNFNGDNMKIEKKRTNDFPTLLRAVTEEH